MSVSNLSQVKYVRSPGVQNFHTLIKTHAMYATR